MLCLAEKSHNEGFQALEIEVGRVLSVPLGRSQTVVISCRTLVDLVRKLPSYIPSSYKQYSRVRQSLKLAVSLAE